MQDIINAEDVAHIINTIKANIKLKAEYHPDRTVGIDVVQSDLHGLNRLAECIFEWYLKRTKRHIELVKTIASKLASYMPDSPYTAELLKQVENHDVDKLNDLDFAANYAPYLVHKYGPQELTCNFDLTDEYKKKWDTIYVVEHCKNNKHHPEGWDETYNYGENNPPYTPRAMDEVSMLEMVCDWMAVGQEMGNTATEWFDKTNGARWLWSNSQKTFILNALQYEADILKEIKGADYGAPSEVHFDTYEEAEAFLRDNYNGHGRIYLESTDECIRSCRCPNRIHEAMDIPKVYTKTRRADSSTESYQETSTPLSEDSKQRIGKYLYHGSSNKFSILTPQIRNNKTTSTTEAKIFFTPFKGFAGFFCIDMNDGLPAVFGEQYDKSSLVVLPKSTPETDASGNYILTQFDKVNTQVTFLHNVKEYKSKFSKQFVGYIHMVRSDKLVDSGLREHVFKGLPEYWYFKPVRVDKIEEVVITAVFEYSDKLASKYGPATESLQISTEAMSNVSVSLKKLDMSSDKDIELAVTAVNLAAKASKDTEWSKDEVVAKLKEVSKKGQEMFLITQTGNPVGYVRLGPYKNSEGKMCVSINDFAIFKQYQGKGLGKLSLQHVIQYCHKKYPKYPLGIGVAKVNTTAIALYKKLGFVVAKEYKQSYFMELKSQSSTESLHIFSKSIPEGIASVDDLKQRYKSIRYGVIDYSVKPPVGIDIKDITSMEEFGKKWQLTSPNDLFKYGYGNCVNTAYASDIILTSLQVQHTVYCMFTEDIPGGHMFVVYRDKQSWKWIEASFEPYNDNNLSWSSENAACLDICAKVAKYLNSKKYSVWKFTSFPSEGAGIKRLVLLTYIPMIKLHKPVFTNGTGNGLLSWKDQQSENRSLRQTLPIDAIIKSVSGSSDLDSVISEESLRISTEAALPPNFKEKRKKIEKYILDSIKLLDPHTDVNTKYWSNKFKSMSDKDFDYFMQCLKDHRTNIHMFAPPLMVHLKHDELIEAAHKLGVKLMHRIWVKDDATGQEYLTPEEYLVVQLPVRRQQQFLDEKISVPDNDKTIDGLTGQVTGDSKACAITNPEIHIMQARNLDASLHEFVNVRGGNIHNYAEFKRSLEETGTVSLNKLDPNNRTRVAVMAGVLLTGMHLESNINENI